MNIMQVRYALAVAKYKSFSKAANSLFITQPALSQQISGLEKELGFPLFLRTPKGVLLTEDGEAFCPDAQAALEAWDTLGRNMRGRKESPSGQLRVSIGPRVYANGLFEPLVAFFDQHPEIAVTLVTDHNYDILDDLAEDRLDLALDRLPPRNLIADPDRFSSWDLVRERQCILLSPEDPRSRCDVLAFQSMEGCPVVTGSKGSMEEKIILQDCREFGISLPKTYRSDSVSTLMRLIHSGKGFAIGPSSFRDYYHLAAVPMLPEVWIALSFICLRQKADDPKLTLLRKFLSDLCRQRFPGGQRADEAERPEPM